MSSVIDEFLTLQSEEHKQESNGNHYHSIWDKIQNQIDLFDKYRIKKALDAQIQRNSDLIEEFKYLMQIWEECKNNVNQPPVQDETAFEHSLFQVPERQLLQKQILLNLKEIKRYSIKKKISIHLLLTFDTKSIDHKTLIYIIKPSKNSPSSKESSKRPQTSFNINPQNIMRKEIILSLNDDIIQQTAYGMLDCLF